MKQCKTQVSAKVLDTIADSQVLSLSEKLNFLKYIGYLSTREQGELCKMI